MKKILGIFFGRKGFQSEIIIKTALKGAFEEGCTVECVNVMDMKIDSCINCMACTRILSDDNFKGHCPLENDDVAWLDEKILSSDGIIFVSPMYEKAIPGKLKMLFDRMGPSHDVTFMKFAYGRRKAAGIDPGIDPRWFTQRPAVIITHGGSDWGQLGFTTLATPCVSLGMKIVGKARFDSAVPIAIDGRLAEAKALGKHIAECVNSDGDAEEFMGANGTCPYCHNDVMRLSDDFTTAECTLCGAVGNIVIAEGRPAVVFSEDERGRSHMFDEGRSIHLKDLQNNAVVMASMDREAFDRARKDALNWLEVSRPER